MTANKTIALWLFICAIAVFTTTQVGAITRLTESGLSIVEWKPVKGALPPLNETEWEHQFTLYKESPQYKKVNAGMSLHDFKKIFFWEWLHRFLDRLVGLIYLLPLLWFWARGQIPQNAKAPLAGLFVLGGLQGVLGWVMVKSGLVDRPAVSHYLLASHLFLAVLLYCFLLRAGFYFRGVKVMTAPPYLRRLVRLCVALVFVTMTWGAFTAGLRAGVVYSDSFPFMGAHLWPAEMFHDAPWWINFFENHAAVQFTHRVLAVLTFIVLMSIAIVGRGSKISLALGLMAFVQVGLGIATVMSQVEITLATLHQAGALVILALLMALLHTLPRNKER